MHSFLETENCIMCLKKARYYTGVVNLGDLKISAGWCESCKKLSDYWGNWSGKIHTLGMGLKLSHLYDIDDLKARKSLLLQ